MLYFKGFIFSTVFLLGQFYSPGTSVNTVLHYCHIMLSLCSVQKTKGFCVADFATLFNERRSRSKIFHCLCGPCVRKFEGLERSKLLGISQTMLDKSYLRRVFS